MANNQELSVVQSYEYEEGKFDLSLSRHGFISGWQDAYTVCEDEQEAAASLLEDIENEPEKFSASEHAIAEAKAILGR